MIEFDLSSKMKGVFKEYLCEDYLWAKDVKEFIRLLKAEINEYKETFMCPRCGQLTQNKILRIAHKKIIDKLAGEKLK